MTAVLRFPGRVWTAFCRPVRSRALGSPPVGPCGGPGPLRTLDGGKEGVKEIEGTILDGGKALIGGEKEGWKVLVGLTSVGNYWTNGKVSIRCGKKGLGEGDWKRWEDEEIVDTFEGKKREDNEDVEMEEGMEVKEEKEEEKVEEDEGSVIRSRLEGVKEERWAKEEEVRGIKKERREVEVIDLCGSSEEGSGVELLEE